MVYILLNHEYPVANIDISKSEHDGSILIKLIEITDMDRIPLSIKYAEDKEQALREFLYRRCLPKSRYAYGRLMALTGLSDPFQISLCGKGSSLADGYWLKKEKHRISWKKVNYFDNPLTYDVGNFICHKYDQDKKICLDSPDLTISGKLRKIWRKKRGDLYLLKIADPENHESIYNEIIGTEILKRISTAPYVKYKKDRLGEYHVCYCKNFLDKDTEFISALELYLTKERDAGVSVEQHILERMEYFKIPDYIDAFKNMRLFDYLSANTNRHLQNFGVLRDVNTLKFKGFAPIFNYRGSLWSDDEMLSKECRETVSSSIEALLTLDIDLDKYDFRKLEGIDEVIREYYYLAGIDKEKTEKIIGLMTLRREMLEREYYKRQLSKEDFEFDFR